MTMLDQFGKLTIEITREQLETFAGRGLTDDEVRDLDEAFPDSTLPDVIAEIVGGFDDRRDEPGPSA